MACRERLLDVCGEAAIPDLAIAKMVAGVEVDLFRPNEELKVLAKLALKSFEGQDFASYVPEEEEDFGSTLYVDPF